jgi:hypothetical protein
VSRTVATFKRLSPAYKAIVALVAPIGTVVGMLLALNVIQPFGEDALAASIDRTTEAATAAINVSYATSPESGQPVRFDAAGAFDYRAGRGQLRYDFSDTAGGDQLRDVEVRFDGRQVYMRLTEGGDWIHADLDTAREEIAEYAEVAGRDPAPGLASIQDLEINDPSQVLAQLRRASEVEKVGEATIFGVPTTRYRATIAPREEGERRLVANAFIDGSGLIRRLDLESREGPSPFTMKMEFTEFGEPVDIRPPAAENVRELQEILDALPAA